MRLWSLHPRYLDQKGLVALWREGLLAQKVLMGETKGYKNHPQLLRFKNTINPVGAIASYLDAIYKESLDRDFNFNEEKIHKKRTKKKIGVTKGQLEYELEHLKRKLKNRDKKKYHEIMRVKKPEANAVFRVSAGDVEEWERRNKT